MCTCLVYLSGSDIIITSQLDIQETFIVSEVKIHLSNTRKGKKGHYQSVMTACFDDYSGHEFNTFDSSSFVSKMIYVESSIFQTQSSSSITYNRF